MLSIASLSYSQIRTVTCSVCGGNGKSICYGCSGTGVMQSSYMDMNGYFWPVQVRCSYCQGRRVVICPTCRGKGTVKVDMSQFNYGVGTGAGGARNPSGRTKCLSCYGSGKCQSCGGSGHTSGWHNMCGTCNNTGRCPGCEGKGYY